VTSKPVSSLCLPCPVDDICMHSKKLVYVHITALGDTAALIEAAAAFQ
jgi:hypothetical protein